MNTRTKIACMTAIAGAWLACDSAMEPSAASDTVAGSITGNSLASETFPATATQRSTGESEIVGWCDEPAGVVRVLVIGSGRITHGGRFETTQTNCLELATGMITEGQGVLITANRDEMFVTYEGRVLPGVEPQTMELTYSVNGGSGRFTSAEGELDLVVVYSSASEWESWGEGWIRYEASDRASR